MHIYSFIHALCKCVCVCDYDDVHRKCDGEDERRVCVCVCVCTRKLEPVTVAIEEAMEALASARSPRWPTNMRETSWMPNCRRLMTIIGPASHSCLFNSVWKEIEAMRLPCSKYIHMYICMYTQTLYIHTLLHYIYYMSVSLLCMFSS